MPFIDPSGYGTSSEIIDEIYSQFQDFGGGKFVKVFLFRGLAKEIDEELVSLALKKGINISKKRVDFESH